MADSTSPVPYAAPVPINTQWAVNIFSLAIILPVVATVAVAGRCVARRQRRARFWVDDWLMLVAMVLFFGHSVANILLVVLGGTGQSALNLQKSVIVNALKIFFATEWTYTLSLGFAKLSVCMLLIRIFSSIKYLQYAIWSIFTLITLWMLATLLLSLTICRPISTVWTIPQPAHPNCGNSTAAIAASGIIDIIIDFLLLLVPLPQVWHLHMPTATKIGLTAVFALGLVDFAIGIRRILYVSTVDLHADFTYNTAQLHFWSTMRPGLAIVIGCALVMRPLLERYLLLPACLKRKPTLGSDGTYSNAKNGYVMMSGVTRQPSSNEDVTTLLHSGDAHNPGETRSVAMTRSKQMAKTSLALPRHAPAPARSAAAAADEGRLRERDAVINVHRFVQVEEEKIGAEGRVTPVERRLGNR